MTPFRLATTDGRPTFIHVGDRAWQLATWEVYDWWRAATTTTGLQVTMWAANGRGCVSVGLASWVLHNVRAEDGGLVADAEEVDFNAVARDVLGVE